MKKINKSIASLVMGAAFVSLLSGCGTGSSSQAAGTTSSPETINFYTGGDTNVENLWQKDLIPKFEKANPNIKVHLVFLTHGDGSDAVLQKIEAAKKTNKVSDVDVWEGDVTKGAKEGLWTKLDSSNVPNISMVDDKSMSLEHNMAIPYRASSVVLAYNKDNVPNPPQTFTQLYDWIGSHKGKFAYNDPSTGGSGDSFVVSTLYNFMDPSDMTKPYDPSLETKWDKGFSLLKQLAPSMYQGGVYPKGNQGTLDLLAKGDIDMAPVWSDMALSEKAKNTLPSNIELTQLDPAFTGGPSALMVPANSAHKDAALKFLNFVLTVDAQKDIVNTMYGYPGIKWSEMPADYQEKFKSVAKDYRFFIGGDYSKDMHKQWQDKVVAK